MKLNGGERGGGGAACEKRVALFIGDRGALIVLTFLQGGKGARQSGRKREKGS